MNLYVLLYFCRKHGIDIEYRYSPKWKMHILHFMGHNGHLNKWLTYEDRIHDDQLQAIGDQHYFDYLIHRMEDEFLPKLKEGDEEDDE